MQMDIETITKMKLIRWSTQSFTLKHIEDNYDFPMITKMAKSALSKKYSQENPYIYLIGKRFLTKIVAQTIEKGNYVIGKAIEIPTNSLIKFRVTDKFKRSQDTTRTFESVEEIAASNMPTVVYLTDQLVYNHCNQNNIFFNPGDEFKIVGPSFENKDKQKKSTSKMFIRSKTKTDVLNLNENQLVMYNTRLQLTIKLPYSLKAKFTTKSPTDNSRWNSMDLTAGQLINKVDFPCTVIVKNKPNYLNFDQHRIVVNTSFKLTGAEKHCFILALDSDNNFIEFQPESQLEFFLPSFLCEFNNEDKNNVCLYDELNCKILKKCNDKNSSTSIDAYLQSVQYYEHRVMRETKPKAVSSLLGIRREDGKQNNTSSFSNKVSELCTKFSRGKINIPADQVASNSAPELPPRSNVIKQSKNKIKSNQTQKPLPPLPTDCSNSFTSKSLTRSRTFCDAERHFPAKFSVSLPQYQPPSPTYSNTKLYYIDDTKIPDDSVTFQNLELKDKFEKQTLKGTLQNSFSTNIDQNKSEENDHILEEISSFDFDNRSLSESTSINSSEKLNDDRQYKKKDQYAKLLKSETLKSSENLSFVSNIKDTLHQEEIEAEESVSHSNEVNIQSLSVSQLSSCFRLIGLDDETISVFKQEKVDGALLITITNEMFSDFFKLSSFHVHKIKQFILGWRPKITEN